jgi:hypothetical protein
MGPYRPENEQVNMFGHEYNVGMYEWMDFMEHSEGVSCMNNVVVDRETESLVLSLLHNKCQNWLEIEALFIKGMEIIIRIGLKEVFL